MADNYHQLLIEYNELLTRLKSELQQLESTRKKNLKLTSELEAAKNKLTQQMNENKNLMKELKNTITKEILAELDKKIQNHETKEKSNSSSKPTKNHKFSLEEAAGIEYSKGGLSFSGLAKYLNDTISLKKNITKELLINWCLDKGYLQEGKTKNAYLISKEGSALGIEKYSPSTHTKGLGYNYQQPSKGNEPGFILNKKAIEIVLKNLKTIDK